MQRVARDPRALAAEVDGEVVALNVARGVCFGLDGVASRIWALIAEPTTAAEVCARLTGEYDVTPEICEREVLTFLKTLMAEGLVTAAPEPESRGA
jgi:hypothetical protein